MSPRTIGAVGVAVMSAAIIYGFAAGSFAAEGSAILDLAWGRVTLVDLYTGMALFGAWVVWREGSLVRALPWLASLVVLGSLAAAAYVVAAARGATTVSGFLTGGRTD